MRRQDHTTEVIELSELLLLCFLPRAAAMPLIAAAIVACGTRKGILERLSGTEQADSLVWNDKLRIVALGNLGEGLELQHC